MAPGLTNRQTGTVPKNKPRNSGSQSHRLADEPFSQLCYFDQEQMSDIGNKSSTRKKRSTSRSETEADSLRHELERSRSSTMTFHNENGEGCSQDNTSDKANVLDQKQVADKLGQIQKYIQQTVALMSSLKSSDSPSAKNQFEKFSVILEDLRDSEFKLSNLLNKMDSAKSKMDSLLMDVKEVQGNNVEVHDLDLVRRSEESKKKLEVLQQKKEELLKLQEKAKRQLKEAQAEQSRLVARASSLNQELGANKITDLNFQQLSQRLKAVQQIYNTTNQIADTLNENANKNTGELNHPEEDQIETSDTEMDFQLVTDKMEKLNVMKAQLSQIQKMMAQISGTEDIEGASCGRESGDYIREMNSNSQTSSCPDEEHGADGGANTMKLEQAKSKLNQLTQLLEFVQSAQNSTGLSSSCIQLVSNLVNEETASSQSLSPDGSDKSPKNREEISMQTMQNMTKELEETTAAMKEERDRLLAARQELQDIAKRLPVNKSEPESLSADDESESEPPRLKPAVLESVTRDVLNGSVEAEKSNCSDGSLYVNRYPHSRNKQRETWESPLLESDSAVQERRSKNEPRSSNQSSRGGSRTNSRNFGGENGHWTSSPSVSYCNERQNGLVETQNQLDISGKLCELMLSESLQKETRPNEISLQEMLSQHQQLVRTVAQCTQLLWLQQKQIIELRNLIMFQYGSLNAQPQTLGTNQIHLNGPPMFNPLYSMGPAFTIASQAPTSSAQQHQTFLHAANPNSKLNMKRSAEIQSSQVPQLEYNEQFMQQANQASMLFSDDFGFDSRSGNFNRFYPSVSSGNQNVQLNSGSNNNGPSGINSMVPEDSRALNNQVPPGNRANNYWDNFRSYSRQNLLSSTKSNEDSEMSRRCSGNISQERPPRDPALLPFLQNNQSGWAPSQQCPQNPGNSEVNANDQFLLIPSQNTWIGSHGQITRSRSVEPQSNRNSGKNESRHNDSESRNLHVLSKNEGSGGVRPRNTDFSSDIRSVKNDVGQNIRNSDNLNSTRNFGQLARDVDHEQVPQGNNKKRLERDRSRNEVTRHLNNRVYHNTNLWDNIYSEVSNLIRANETRPDFLHHLFRGLQLVTTDNLRQRTLLTIQEAVSANNVFERQSNMSGGNASNIENRKNIRENRSNVNVNQPEDPSRIDELFFHLRENQNTIRQNIGMSSYMLGGNLENPNISNIRDLGSSRNNLESEGLRDLRTYFEANLCNFGHNSTLENPNLSNIRENLMRRDAGTSDFDYPRPKNVYLSIFDNSSGEQRRRGQESSSGPTFGPLYGNLSSLNDYLAHEFSDNRENVREINNQFDLENNYEGAVGGRLLYRDGNSPTDSRLLDAGDNFNHHGQFVGNGNDSGIDINFNSEERKLCLAERIPDTSDRSAKLKKNGNEVVEGGASLVLPEWERNMASESSFGSSMVHPRKEVATSFIPVCDNSFFSSRAFQQSDNGDLAEADQSRNEEMTGGESHCGFTARGNQNTLFALDQDLPSSENNFASQNIPESERNFAEYNNQEKDESLEGACAAEPEGNLNFPHSASEPEGNFMGASDSGDGFQRKDTPEEYFYQLNPSSSSESAQMKSSVRRRRKIEESAGKGQAKEVKKGSCKSLTNRFREAFLKGKYGEGSPDDCENQKTDSESVDGLQRTESIDSFCLPFRLALEKSWEAEREKTSAEAESDWECGSGLDQVPTRLNKKGSSKKSDNSDGGIP